MPQRMPEDPREPRHRNGLGYWDRRIPFENTTWSSHSTPAGGLVPPGCDRANDYDSSGCSYISPYSDDGPSF